MQRYILTSFVPQGGPFFSRPLNSIITPLPLSSFSPPDPRDFISFSLHQITLTSSKCVFLRNNRLFWALSSSPSLPWPLLSQPKAPALRAMFLLLNPDHIWIGILLVITISPPQQPLPLAQLREKLLERAYQSPICSAEMGTFRARIASPRPIRHHPTFPEAK